MNNLLFPYYSGNIKMPKVLGHVSVSRFIEAHLYPTNDSLALLVKINKASLSGDKKLKNKLKEKLFSFTPSVYVQEGFSRKYDNVDYFTGIYQLDFDGIETPEKAVMIKEHIFDSYDSIICSYLSPSGLGVKCLLKANQPKDIEHYRAIYKAVENEFGQFGYFDTATKNAILPLFLSMDKKILFRKLEEVVEWNKEDWSKEEYINLNDIPKPDITTEKLDVYKDKVVRIITDRINAIVDNGHPQVRDTSLVLGSRVGAGYLAQYEAEQLIEYLIKSNSYLQKGINGYIKTSRWGIKNGIGQPKFF